MRERLKGLWIFVDVWLIFYGTLAYANDDMALAKKFFNMAEEHFSSGNYKVALEYYQMAYEAKPLVGFHFNIGQCYRNLSQYQKAIHHFRLYLKEGKNVENRDAAKKLIEICQNAMDAKEAERKKTESHPPEPPNNSPQSQPLMSHDVQQTVAPKKRKRLNPIFFWTGVGVSSTLILTGIITGAIALNKSAEFNDPETPRGSLTELKDEGESSRTTANIAFGLGLAAATATAAIFFFTDFKHQERRVGAQLIVDGALFTFGGRY